MNWPQAEALLKAFVEGQWAASIYASIPLVWENALDEPAATMIYATVEGVYTEASMYGSSRCVVSAGIVYFHAFTPLGSGKDQAIAMVDFLTTAIELQSIAEGLNTDIGNPPTPVEARSSVTDRGIPIAQPGGDYFRCSGSVPFIVIDTR